jgi:hypothetical protein
MPKSIDVPELDHDAMMLTRYGHKVGPIGRLERRLVAAFCAHMADRGWRPSQLDDGETVTPVHDAKSAMELIFNLDESCLTFTDGTHAHAVLLINGNGIDMISDYASFRDDRDCFAATVAAFDPEACA